MSEEGRMRRTKGKKERERAGGREEGREGGRERKEEEREEGGRGFYVRMLTRRMVGVS